LNKNQKIVDRAKLSIAGFEKVFKVIHQNTVLKGQSKSTFYNYIRKITKKPDITNKQTKYCPSTTAIFYHHVIKIIINIPTKPY